MIYTSPFNKITSFFSKITLFLLVSMLCAPLKAGFEHIEIDLGGISCSVCASQLTAQLSTLKHQSGVTIDLGEKKAYVTFEPHNADLNLVEIKDKVTKSGYVAHSIKLTAAGSIKIIDNNFVLKIPGFNQVVYLFDETYSEPYKNLQPSNKGTIQLLYSYKIRNELSDAAKDNKLAKIKGSVHLHSDGSLAINVEERSFYPSLSSFQSNTP